MPEPIRLASGMMAQQPICSSSRATIGSSEVYTITSKPSATSTSAAFSVSRTLGNSVFGSPSTSSLTSRWSSSSSRASLRVRTASSALKQPAVLGSRV